MFTRLDPKLDVVFKLLFTRPGSEGILIALLTAILRPPSAIRSVKVLNPELEKEAIPDRGVVLDIRVRLEDGREVDVEMQSQPRPGMTKRALYHWSRMYGAQIVRGQDYAELQPCISIFLLGYEELPAGRFHSIFQVLEVHDHEPLADQLEIHVIELPRLPSRGSPEYDREGKLADWGRFFRAADDAELEELAMSDEVFGKAKEALDELSADPYTQHVARLREEGLAMYRMEMNEAGRLGEARGEARGRIQAKRELLVRLLEHRFGSLSDRARETLDQSSSEQITRWALTVLSASCIEDVFDVAATDPDST